MQRLSQTAFRAIAGCGVIRGRVRPRSGANVYAPGGVVPSLCSSPPGPHHLLPQPVRYSSGRSGYEAGSSTGNATGPAEEDVFHDPREDVLRAALPNVSKFGWTDNALAAGARECGFHSVSAGMFSRGAIELVEYFMDQALAALKQEVATRQAEFTAMTASDRLKHATEIRLRQLEPYIDKWPEAMALGARPQNVGSVAKAIAVLADELAFISGDRSTDTTWYARRAVIASIYTSAEFYMVADQSPGHRDTWAFLDRRMSDYDKLTTTPQNLQDIVGGLSTAVSSIGSAFASLLHPALSHLPGKQTLSDATQATGLVMQGVLSYLSSLAPSSSRPVQDKPRRPFPGAPEVDPEVDDMEAELKQAEKAYYRPDELAAQQPGAYVADTSSRGVPGRLYRADSAEHRFYQV